MRRLTSSEIRLVRKIETEGLHSEANAVQCFLSGQTTSLSIFDQNTKDRVLSFADEMGVNLEKNKLSTDVDPP